MNEKENFAKSGKWVSNKSTFYTQLDHSLGF